MPCRMLRNTVIFGLTLSVLVARAGRGPGDEGGAKDDNKELQGPWVAVPVESRGTRLPADQVRKFLVRFQGDQVTIQRGNKAEQATYRLIPNTTPKTISFTDKRGKRRFGIYEFTEKGLKLCIARPELTPPARF